MSGVSVSGARIRHFPGGVHHAIKALSSRGYEITAPIESAGNGWWRGMGLLHRATGEKRNRWVKKAPVQGGWIVRDSAPEAA